MFWGWYSFGNGPRSSGCFFLPFLFVCGLPFFFTGFNSRFLLPLILIAILGLVIPAILNRGGQQEVYAEDWSGEPYDGDKPKRDFDKPKRTDDYLYRDDGEVLEVVDPPRDREPVYRDDTDVSNVADTSQVPVYRDAEVSEVVDVPQEPIYRDDAEVFDDIDTPQEPVQRDDNDEEAL